MSGRPWTLVGEQRDELVLVYGHDIDDEVWFRPAQPDDPESKIRTRWRLLFERGDEHRGLEIWANGRQVEMSPATRDELAFQVSVFDEAVH